MINVINRWMKQIIFAVVITIIIEMLVPEGKNKKYIKMITNIYIIFIIVSPIFSKLTLKEINLNEIFINESTKTVAASSIDNTKYIEERYIKNIKESINTNLSNIGYEVKNIDVFINIKDEKYGQIEKIRLSVEKKQKEEIKKIEKVSIGTENNSNMEQNLSEEDIQIITNYLMINYGVIESNITLERSGFENEKI
ncbi:MAG: stage III sporulation protein AF [Clostridia bacterium]